MEDLLAKAPEPDLTDPGQMHHGGPVAVVELGNSGLASMNVVDDTKTTSIRGVAIAGRSRIEMLSAS